jgi:diacylglycerol kinase (ATP)
LKNTLIIINPVSARGTTGRTWTEVRRQLLKLGLEFTEHITSRAGDATKAARDALLNGVTRVVAVGGDGTLSEIVNGYIDDAGHPINEGAALGILPSGTGSDFSRSIGLKSREEAIASLIGSTTTRIDAARIGYTDTNGAAAYRSFINVASFGLGGDVSAFVNKWRASLPFWIGGRIRFATAAVRALERYRNHSVKIRIDNEREIEISSNLIVIANGMFGGAGMKLAPRAELDDGLFDVVITDRATRFDVIRELPRIRRGGYLNNPKVSELRAREVAITADQPMAIDVDGEMVGHTPARLEVLPRVVRFLINDNGQQATAGES